MAGPDVAYSIDHALETLATPQPQETVEAIEVALKRHWSTVLDAGRDASASQAFSQTFHRLGFLRKYKSYGIKFSSPFGYSIFTLHDGKGFSVQVHTVAKVEAFHFFAAHDTSFAILSSEADWHASSAEFLSEWSAGVLDDGPLGFRPAAGDVMVIDDLGVVHAVIGCVLEEYATTSNDAVLRLHDQNAADEVVPPERHPDLGEVLRPLLLVAAQPRPARPDRLAARGARRHGAPDHDRRHGRPRAERLPPDARRGPAAPHGRRARLRDDARLPAGCDRRGGRRHRVATRPGDSAPIAPGWDAGVRATHGPSRVAVSVVREDLAFADLRTTR